MAKLPNGDKAVVPLEKLTDYALNPEHSRGKHKARVFKSALGLTLEDAAFLQTTIQQIAATHDAIPEAANDFGERYVIDFLLTTEQGAATIRTAWIIRFADDEKSPYLTSCYVI
jgi:hypothetical protein